MSAYAAAARKEENTITQFRIDTKNSCFFYVVVYRQAGFSAAPARPLGGFGLFRHSKIKSQHPLLELAAAAALSHQKAIQTAHTKRKKRSRRRSQSSIYKYRFVFTYQRADQITWEKLYTNTRYQTRRFVLSETFAREMNFLRCWVREQNAQPGYLRLPRLRCVFRVRT